MKLLLIAALACGAAFAQAKIGVINLQAALASTRDGKKAQEELDQRMQPRKKDLERMQIEIKKHQEDLAKGGPAMSEAAKADLSRNIDTKTKSYNRALEDAQAELQSEQNKVVEELGQKLMVVVDKYAKDNGYTLVLDANPQSPIVFASTTIDITQAVIDLYDKNSTPPAGAAPPAATKPAPMPSAAPPAKKITPPVK